MTMTIDKLKAHQQAGDRQAFTQELNSFLPDLQKMAGHKLRQWEAWGIVPRNEYTAQDIVDEVYLRLFENKEQLPENTHDLKIAVFSLARQVFNELKEKHHGKQVAVEELLRQEMRQLQEDYTADAEGELLMLDDLDELDISYQNEQARDNVLLLANDQIDQLIESMGLAKDMNPAQRKTLARIYTDLPEQVRSVVDHFVFLKLSQAEVAAIHGITIEETEQILSKVEARLRQV